VFSLLAVETAYSERGELIAAARKLMKTAVAEVRKRAGKKKSRGTPLTWADRANWPEGERGFETAYTQYLVDILNTLKELPRRELAGLRAQLKSLGIPVRRKYPKLALPNAPLGFFDPSVSKLARTLRKEGDEVRMWLGPVTPDVEAHLAPILTRFPDMSIAARLIAATIDELCKHYPWSPVSALLFVLDGRHPVVKRVDARGLAPKGSPRSNALARGKIVLEIDPIADPEEVKLAYTRARLLFCRSAKMKGPHRRTMMLLELVLRSPHETDDDWADLARVWRKEAERCFDRPDQINSGPVMKREFEYKLNSLREHFSLQEDSRSPYYPNLHGTKTPVARRMRKATIDAGTSQ